MRISRLAVGMIAGLIGLQPAAAQRPPDPSARLAAQKAALTRFAKMDGIWRGQATTRSRDGVHAVIQTERVGPMLDGTVRIVEGRGYNADGSTAFNAFGVISYEPSKDAYEFRSFAQGQAGTFAIRPTDDGFVWEIPAGPAIIRYTATIKGDAWRETGERLVPGQAPQPFFEMNLQRIGDTDWPAGSAVPPRSGGS